MIISFYWPLFTMRFNTDTGECLTHYSNDRWSGCEPVPEDLFHGNRLGITPELHRLEHEIAHHLIGLSVYKHAHGSPVIYRDACHESQDKGGFVKPGWSEADREEWLTSALQYHAHGKSTDYGALLDLQAAGVDVAKMAGQLRALVMLAENATSDMGLLMGDRRKEERA